MIHSLKPLPLGRAFVLASLGFLGACAHPGPDVVAITGGAGSGGGGGTVITFALADLDGDWVGKLLPDETLRAENNFYLRITGGDITEAANSLGHEWTSLDSTQSLEFSETGVFAGVIESTLYSNSLSMDAQMDDAMSMLTGSYSHLIADGSLITGSFTLMRSSGAGHFDVALMAGDWDGFGTNPTGKRRLLSFSMAADGSVESGVMTHPVTLVDDHTYSPGAGTFAFADDAIGRLDDVVLASRIGAPRRGIVAASAADKLRGSWRAPSPF
ncbi:MAG: hypothetical protein ACYSU1_03315 [Planctomycetota bacterium]